MNRSAFTSKQTTWAKAILLTCFFLGWLITLLLVFTETHAQGNLLVTPRRVVFDGKKKMQELNLANTGKDTARYVISIMDIRMKEDGSFEQITEPDSGQHFAGQQLRIFPRSVVLAPNESQVVKVQVIKTEQLETGEYRSHIYFRAVPPKKESGETPNNSNEIAVRLTPIFGISIPVIIRVGISDTKVNLSDVALDMTNESEPRLSLAFNRTGNMSSYGDVTVNYIAPNGKITKAAFVRGVAVYTPNAKRQLRIDLGKIPGVDYHTGRLRIVYKNQKDAGSEDLAYAEIELNKKTTSN